MPQNWLTSKPFDALDEPVNVQILVVVRDIVQGDESCWHRPPDRERSGYNMQAPWG